MSTKWSACAVLSVVIWFGAPLICLGQSDTGTKNKIRAEKGLQLALGDNVVAKSELAQGFVDPINCDSDGLAVLFREPQTREESIQIANLEGHEVATYDEPQVDGRGTLGSAFACYLDNPERSCSCIRQTTDI